MADFGYNTAVWRKLHILSRTQVFVVSSLSTAVITIPIAVASISHDETAILRDLFWPHQLAPLIIFSSVFLALLPLLLAYYNLGRLGAMLCPFVSFVMLYGLSVCAIFIFQYLSPWLAVVAYLGACVLLYLLVLRLHMKAATSHTVQDAQNALRLVRHDPTR
jgi:hypothetical protein